MPSPTLRRLELLAWSNVILHGAGLAVAWFGLRPGSVVARSPSGWPTSRPIRRSGAGAGGSGCSARWCSSAYVAVLERLLPPRSTAGRLALVLTASGMAVDLLCDVLQISVLPLAAAGRRRRNVPLPRRRAARLHRRRHGGERPLHDRRPPDDAPLRAPRRRPARIAGWATVVSGYAMAAGGPPPVARALAGHDRPDARLLRRLDGAARPRSPAGPAR